MSPALESKLAQGQQDIMHVHQIAVALAPAFRDKYDFSDESDYAKLATVSYKAADALWAARQKRIEDLQVKIELEDNEEQKREKGGKK